MIPSPILKALSTIRTRQVDHLLMGGQACVLYGAAEFSRDLALLPDPHNLDRLRTALGDLQAEVIAVPPFPPSCWLRVWPSTFAVRTQMSRACVSTS